MSDPVLDFLDNVLPANVFGRSTLYIPKLGKASSEEVIRSLGESLNKEGPVRVVYVAKVGDSYRLVEVNRAS